MCIEEPLMDFALRDDRFYYDSSYPGESTVAREFYLPTKVHLCIFIHGI